MQRVDPVHAVGGSDVVGPPDPMGTTSQEGFGVLNGRPQPTDTNKPLSHSTSFWQSVYITLAVSSRQRANASRGLLDCELRRPDINHAAAHRRSWRQDRCTMTKPLRRSARLLAESEFVLRVDGVPSPRRSPTVSPGPHPGASGKGPGVV